MTHQDKSIIILCLTTCILILLLINLTLGINYTKQVIMQNVLRDCKVDLNEQKYFKDSEVETY